MTRAPLVMLKPERGFPRGNGELVDTTIGWRFINPSLAERYSTESMGETAENVAERYGVSREDQDAFALESHRRAIAAAEAGRFDDEIVTVDVPQPKGEPVTVHADEGPRPDTTLERLAALQAGLPGGRHRHGRQRLADQRRRRVRGGRERGARPRAGPRAAGADRGQRLRRRRPGVHGHRPGARRRARRSSAPASSRRTSTSSS